MLPCRLQAALKLSFPPSPSSLSLLPPPSTLSLTLQTPLAFTTSSHSFSPPLSSSHHPLSSLPLHPRWQTIDAGAGTLANAIEFTEEGFLKVNSNFKNAQGSRFEFKFQSCKFERVNVCVFSLRNREWVCFQCVREGMCLFSRACLRATAAFFLSSVTLQAQVAC